MADEKLITETPAKIGRPAGKEARVPELDGIRGIAVLMVMVAHADTFVDNTWTGLPGAIVRLLHPLGAGVDLFFVLSGFLITGILLDAVHKPRFFRNFYGRRALRILPLYYLILLLIFLSYPHSGSFILLGLFYISNMTAIFGVPNIYAPLWSLSVEEHFYLLWPWVVSRLRQHRLAIAAIGIVIAEPIVRAICFWHGWDVFPYSWCRFDGIASGAFLATFVRSPRHTGSRLFRFSLGCAAAAAGLTVVGLPLGILTRTRLFGDTFDYTVFNLFFVALVGVTVSGRVPPITGLMRFRPLRWVGDVSYCLYIIHFLVFHTWDALVGRYPPWLVASLGRLGAVCARAAGVYVVCFAVAELSRRYFEGPILKMKRIFA